jgi:hypothetical protein
MVPWKISTSWQLAGSARWDLNGSEISEQPTKLQKDGDFSIEEVGEWSRIWSIDRGVIGGSRKSLLYQEPSSARAGRSRRAQRHPYTSHDPLSIQNSKIDWEERSD